MNIIKSILSLSLCVISTSFVHSQSDSPPNILLIFCDDLNLSGLGSDYNSDIVTPVLDSLVNEGIVFTNAYANATICGPSRASVFTGIHPIRSGHYGYQMGFNSWQDNPVLGGASTLFNHFKENGYDVFGTGKIFHGTRTPLADFTHINEGPDQGPWPYQRRSHSLLPESFNSKKISFSPLEDIPSFPEYTGWTYRDGSPFYFGSSHDRDLMGDELSVEYCDSLFLAASMQDDNPFFLTIGLFNPHEPFHVPQEYFDLYNLDSLSLEGIIPSCDLEVIAEHSNRWNFKDNYDTFDELLDQSESADSLYWLKEYIRGYYASVSFIDHQIGKVINSLKENQLDENTIIVISSDHGFHLGRRCSVRKTTLNSEASRIPLIILGPNFESQIIETPASLIDLYPTFCEWGGISPPEDQLDGKSLLPIISGSEDNVAIISVAGMENLAVNQPGTATRQHHSVVLNQFKLNLHSSGEYQLFETASDPFEVEDLSKGPGYASFVLQGLANLSSLIADNKPLANQWEKMFYGNFSDGLEAWLFNDACEFGSFFEADEFLQNHIRITPNGNTAVLRNKSVLFSDTGTHHLNMNVLISGDSVSIFQKVEQNESLLLSNNTTLAIGWHSLSLPFTTNATDLQKQCTYELNAAGLGQAYIRGVSISEENTLSNLMSVCEAAIDMPSNTSQVTTDSIPFEFASIPLINPGSNLLFPRSVLKFTPADSAGFIVIRGAEGTNPSIGVFTSCSPGLDPLFHSDARSDGVEKLLLTNLTPGLTHYALIEQKALGVNQGSKFRAAYFDIPRAQIDAFALTGENWELTLSLVDFYSFEPAEIEVIVTGFNGYSTQINLTFSEEGIYSGPIPGFDIPASGTIRVAYRSQRHNVLPFSEPYNFTFSTESTPAQNLVLLNNQLSSSTAYLSVVTPEAQTNSVWKISMYDLMGKKVYQRSYFPSEGEINQIPVNLNQLTNSIYVFKLAISEQFWTSLVLLVE
ncbi:MAG: arylsulfatase A-like enzyme [Cryomorphaceae bacterium]|jgi:arylsulfatase A-like enzyme